MSGDDLTLYKHDVQKVHFNCTILAHLCIWDLEEWLSFNISKELLHCLQQSPLHCFYSLVIITLPRQNTSED